MVNEISNDDPTGPSTQTKGIENERFQVGTVIEFEWVPRTWE